MKGANHKTRQERELYPIVKQWMQKSLYCFKTDINKGLTHGRIDVVGVRDIGGEISGEVETIGIEVKTTSQSFADACGQTLSYKVYVNRVYLAQERDKPFDIDECSIASELGIGLIQIRRHKCIEVLSSPYYKPISRFNLSLLRKLTLGKCQLCESCFDYHPNEFEGLRLTTKGMHMAIQQEKGLTFFNSEETERKSKKGMIKKSNLDYLYVHRLICHECVSSLFSSFVMKSKS